MLMTSSLPPSSQNLVGATTSKDHPRKIYFAREIGQAVRYKHQPDVDAVIAHLQRKQSTLTRQEADLEARSRAMAPYVRTCSRVAQVTISHLLNVVSNYEEMDKRGKARGELPLLRPNLQQGKSGPRGTRSVLDRLISCLLKGCGTDPLPVDQM